jgi:hypothetical protein
MKSGFAFAQGLSVALLTFQFLPNVLVNFNILSRHKIYSCGSRQHRAVVYPSATMSFTSHFGSLPPLSQSASLTEICEMAAIKL